MFSARRLALGTLVAALLVGAAPGSVCGTERCPMDRVARQACRRMGGDCCPGAARADRAPASAVSSLTAMPSVPAAPAPDRGLSALVPTDGRPRNATALHPEIARFTLYATFLI